MNQLKNIIKYGVLGLLAVTLFCATEKSQLTDSGKFNIVKAEPDKSLMLKNTCRPVAAYMGLTDAEAVVAAVKHNADTVQLFHTYLKPVGLLTTERVRDLRFWSCASTALVQGKKTAIKSKKSIARIMTLRFVNETPTKARDYEWLANTLPEALEAALEKRFIFEKADRQKTQLAFDSLGIKGSKPTETDSRAFCQQADLDMVIYGVFSYNEKKDKIEVTAEIFHAGKTTVISKLDMESGLDGSIFGKVNELSEKAVKSVFANELKR